MRIARAIGLPAVLAAALSFSACTGGSDSPAPGGSSKVGTTGLALAGAGDGSDAVGFHYVITRVACEGEVLEGDPQTWEATEDFEPLVLPGGFAGTPMAPGSTHEFADHFFVLEPGCYDVVATPVMEDGSASEDCAPATKTGVRVEAHETTEILLVSQCEGASNGALDVIATINHPPMITDVEFTPSKFNAVCVDTTICVTAMDPDGDPVDLVLETDDTFTRGPTEVSSTTNADGSVTECFSVGSDVAGRFELRVTAYDLVVDENGELIRWETWYANNGQSVQSRDWLDFPVYFLGAEQCGPGEDVSEPEEDIAGPQEDVEEDVSPPEEDVTDAGPPDCGCTRTQGYWKTHFSGASPSTLDIAWPMLDETPEGGFSENLEFCGETWLDVLGASSNGNAFYILGKQLIAARLNVGAGTCSSASIDATIEASMALMAALCDDKMLVSGEADYAQAILWASQLDDYNNGDAEGTPDHCEDEEEEDD